MKQTIQMLLCFNIETESKRIYESFKNVKIWDDYWLKIKKEKGSIGQMLHDSEEYPDFANWMCIREQLFCERMFK